MAGLRKCLDCGALGHHDRSGRCVSCKRSKMRAIESNPERRAVKAERYGSLHVRIRARFAGAIAQGVIVKCGRYRLGQCMMPDPRIHPGQEWDLDHLDELGGLEHPSHALCNRSAARRS